MTENTQANEVAVGEAMDDAGNCPICYSWDDDLAYRAGICETCYQENKDA